MKYTLRIITSILLSFALLAGMATLFATGVSAASGLTVHVTSNLTNLFPEADVTMDDSEGMVKVTYFINTPEYKIMDCE